MAKTVSDVMVAALKSSGVRRVYGIPGDSVNGFTDALRRDGEITWEHVRHEEAAGFAAAAEAAVTGQLAVCAGSCGPGQPAPDQRPVRRQPQPGAGAGDRRADPAGGDRRELLPGDPSAGAVPRVQRLPRAGQHPRAAPADTGDRDARRRWSAAGSPSSWCPARSSSPTPRPAPPVRRSGRRRRSSARDDAALAAAAEVLECRRAG